jgi:hypothetical protein
MRRREKLHHATVCAPNVMALVSLFAGARSAEAHYVVDGAATVSLSLDILSIALFVSP